MASLPHTLDSIGKLIDGEYMLTAYCSARGCDHQATLDLHVLARRLGRDHSYLHPHLAPKLRCSVCGQRRPEIRLAAKTGVPR